MSVILSPIGGAAWQFFNNDGTVLAGGKIYTYAAGTSTAAPTYTTYTGSIAHTNPIILDSAGRVPSGQIWLSFGVSYKFIIRDSANALIGTFDNIAGSGTGNNVENYTGDGTTVSFALPVGISDVYNIFINGVYQNRNTYSLSAGNIVFTQAPPFTSIIEVQV
jgi:hypothetical protein